ncbi:MAG TPA: bifunctional molybdenum cofactor biosynthesis protein MoaC/MoaB [Nevskiaceae bacterium]|nr:bifunctional molybdenum cofactor biosynthesis protein MoaC/MoaB [Nevskiaceae bacterium]
MSEAAETPDVAQEIRAAGMADVSRKPDTLRTARASATITMPAFCLPLLRERRTKKGDALAAARVAAIMAVKHTSDVIPLCHPMPIQDAKVTFTLGDASVTIEVEVQVIANTGVEMEALTGASIAALTLYDMLKPHAGTALSIGDIHLIEKRGGKSHYKRHIEPSVNGAVIVLSDTVAAGRAQDTAGALVHERLHAAGIECPPVEVIPDEPAQLAERVRYWAAQDVALVVTVGGTGVGPRDRTVETVTPLLEMEIPGIMEAARSYGQRRMPFAMLSRGVAGLIGRTLVITTPGSRGGASEYMDALIPGILHAFQVVRGVPHKHGYNQ